MAAPIVARTEPETFSQLGVRLSPGTRIETRQGPAIAATDYAFVPMHYAVLAPAASVYAAATCSHWDSCIWTAASIKASS